MADQQEKKPSLRVHYIKSNYFRVIRAEGAMGGLSPSGDIFLSLYNQRAALPDVTVLSIENGHLSNEIMEERRGGVGIVRELEVGVSLNESTARALIQWLQDHVDLMEKMRDTAPQESEVNR